MLITISPAKIQNFKPQTATQRYTLPEYMKEAEHLVQLVRALTPTELSKLLEINSGLTQLNFDRYFNWHKPFTPDNAKQAALAFDGEVFRGLDAKTFTDDDYVYAQQHLRILSGLYGVLRPLDLIQPYRLEVSSKLANERGNDLYDFWRDKITSSIVKALKASGNPQILINLTSGEYFKSIDLKKSKIKVISIEFYEFKYEKLKQIVIYTKKARGLMARYIIENRIEDVEDLKGFDKAGYWFHPQLSNEQKFVFVRS